MPKLEVDITSVKNDIILLNDVISLYNKSLMMMKNTYIPHNFRYSNLYNSIYTSMNNDKNELTKFKQYLDGSLKDLDYIENVYRRSIMSMPSAEV